MLKIAHRGHKSKDNTREAFLNAIKHFDMLEADIHKTADNRIVLFHDDFIEGRFIENMYLNQIRSIDPDVLSLDEFFAYFPPSKYKILLDLKGCTELANLLKTYIQENNIPLHNIIIASFNRKHLHSMFYSGIGVKLAFITYNVFNSPEYGSILSLVDYLVIDTSILTKELMQDIKPYNVKVLVCTCTSQYVCEYMKKFPIQGIISDIII